MKMTIERIEAGKLLQSSELARLGLAPRQVLRVELETIDDDSEIGITQMNERGGAFAHLVDEPEIYSDNDLIERNEAFVR
jgi:hypothetical protein